MAEHQRQKETEEMEKWDIRKEMCLGCICTMWRKSVTLLGAGYFKGLTLEYAYYKTVSYYNYIWLRPYTGWIIVSKIPTALN